MTDERLDRMVRQLLSERADDVAAAALPADVMAERITGQLRPSPLRRRWVLLAAATLLVALAAAAAAVGPGLLRIVRVPDAVPNVEPHRAPMGDDGLPWPLRGEPTIGTGAVRLERLGAAWDAPFAFRDAIGDIGQLTPWLDLMTVEIQAMATSSEGTGMAAEFSLAGRALRPVPDSSGGWLAYGYVIDTNGDGVGDHRIGMDNAGPFQHREWITDLATGETTMNAGGTWGLAGDGVFIDTYFPGEPGRADHGKILVVVDQPPPLRFYVWSSVMGNDGESITDYAPDVSWIEFRPVPIQ